MLSKPSPPAGGTTPVPTPPLRLPDKIMAILLQEEAPDAIWWLQKGTAFAMQKELFQEQILDKHFRGNKFKSLVRNLHRWYEEVQFRSPVCVCVFFDTLFLHDSSFSYLFLFLSKRGFKRMTCDSSAEGKTIAFSHKLFRKDNPELVKDIQITKDKDHNKGGPGGAGGAAAAGKATEKIKESVTLTRHQEALDAQQRQAAAVATANAALRMSAPTLTAASSSPTMRGGGGGAMTSMGGLAAAAAASSHHHQHLLPQQPSLHSMVAAEHHHNLTQHGTESLLHSMEAPLPMAAAPAVGAGLGGAAGRFSALMSSSGPLSRESSVGSVLYGGLAPAAGGREREPMSPATSTTAFGSSTTTSSDRMQLMGSLFRPSPRSQDSMAVLEQQRRESFMLQQLAALPTETRNRILLQQSLGNRRLTSAMSSTTTPATTSAASRSLLPQPSFGSMAGSSQSLLPSVDSQYLNYLSQFAATTSSIAGPPQQSARGVNSSMGLRHQQVGGAGAGSLSAIEQALLLGHHASTIPTRHAQQQQQQQHPGGNTSAASGLTAEHQRILDEMRRRRDS